MVSSIMFFASNTDNNELYETMKSLYEELQQPQKIQSPQMPFVVQPALDKNLPTSDFDDSDAMPQYKRNHPPAKMKIVKDYMTKIAQFVDLIWRNQWVVSAQEGHELTQEECNYWFGAILDYDFDKNGATSVSRLYNSNSKQQPHTQLGQYLIDLSQNERKRRIEVNNQKNEIKVNKS